MNILSLFDGISCGQVALNRAGIKYDKYFASEIDKKAICITQYNYPNTIQLGSVYNIKGKDLPEIDLLFGGSPCQGFSSSGKRLNFEDKRSMLFFEFVRLLKECKPKHWLFENVVMSKEVEEIVNEQLGTKPVTINSATVSAQNRVRLYWSWDKLESPKDKGIKLITILENRDMPNKASIIGRRINSRGVREDYNKNVPLIQCLEVRRSNTTKSNCLTTVDKDNVLTSLPIGRYIDVFKRRLPFRYYTLNEYCRLQTIPENYFDYIVSESETKKLIGNGWTVDVIVDLLRQMLKEEE